MKIIKTNQSTEDEYTFIFKLLLQNDIYHFYGQLKKYNEEVECCTTLGITDKPTVAEEIYATLVDNCVAPSHFYYIIDEIMG